MRNSLFYLIPLLLLGAGCVAQEVEPPYDLVEIEEVLTSHQDQMLDITFSYPSSWGPITSQVEANNDDIVHLPLTFTGVGSNGILVAAYKEGETLGRGGYFGDQARLFTSPEATQEWCELEQHTVCESLTNEQGVEIWYTYTAVANVWGEELLEIDEYAIHHPNHPFYGIIVSNERLVSNGLGRNEEALRALVESLEFVE
jgi:hypothetical protein